MNEKMIPLEGEVRLKYRDLATQLDRRYEQERKRQDEIGINFSRITPTASFIFLATDVTQTGQVKRNTYFQTGTRYYETLDAEIFSKISEAALIPNRKNPVLNATPATRGADIGRDAPARCHGFAIALLLHR